MDTLEGKEIKMARVRRNIDAQIKAAQEQVVKAKAKLEMLEQQLDELCMKKKEQEIGELYDYLQEKGVSVEEVMQMIHEENREIAS